MSRELLDNFEERMFQTESTEELVKIAKAYKDVSDADCESKKYSLEDASACADKLIKQRELDINEKKIKTDAYVKGGIALAAVITTVAEGVFKERGVFMEFSRSIGKLFKI